MFVDLNWEAIIGLGSTVWDKDEIETSKTARGDVNKVWGREEDILRLFYNDITIYTMHSTRIYICPFLPFLHSASWR